METLEQAFVVPRLALPVEAVEAVIDHQEALEEAVPPPPTDESLRE